MLLIAGQEYSPNGKHMIHFNKKTLEKCVICSKVYTKDTKTTLVMLLQCLYF